MFDFSIELTLQFVWHSFLLLRKGSNYVWLVIIGASIKITQLAAVSDCLCYSPN